MPLYKVRKRNGAIVTFDRNKIGNAIEKAVESVGGIEKTEIPSLVDEIIVLTEEKAGDELPDIEMIQDSIEQILMHHGYDALAKAYILYREQHAQIRDHRSVVVEVGNTMEEYLHRSDWRVNANANSGYSLG